MDNPNYPPDSAAQALPSSIPSVTCTDQLKPWRKYKTVRVFLERIMQARSTFIILQVFDLMTTIAAFHAGAFEVNPLVARLTLEFGRIGGVMCSKVIAVLIAFGVRKRLWIVNVFYSGVVIWNVIVLFALWGQHH